MLPLKAYTAIATARPGAETLYLHSFEFNEEKRHNAQSEHTRRDKHVSSLHTKFFIGRNLGPVETRVNLCSKQYTGL